MQFPGSSEESRLLLPAFFFPSSASGRNPSAFIGRLLGGESEPAGEGVTDLLHAPLSLSLHYLLLAAIPAGVRRGEGGGGGEGGACVSTQSLVM